VSPFSPVLAVSPPPDDPPPVLSPPEVPVALSVELSDSVAPDEVLLPSVVAFVSEVPSSPHPVVANAVAPIHAHIIKAIFISPA
jgi:hypothetical protein